MIIDLNNQKHRDLINKLIEEYYFRLTTYNNMEQYYNGNTKANREYKLTDRSNRKARVKYIKKFVNEETSFAVGNPIAYNSVDKEKIDTINYIINNQIAQLDIENANTLGEFGCTYEMHYLSNGEFKIKTLRPKEAIAYRNTEGEVELFLYFYKKELDDNKYIDIIDDNYIYQFVEGNLQSYNVIQHIFGKCPVGVGSFLNGVEDTIYADIHELVDLYEETLWDCSNNIADLRASYMVLTGCSLDEEEAKKMKRMGILQLPDSSGKAEWLTKNLESDFCNNLIEKIEDLIYQQSSHINHNVVMASNTSGVALSSRLISLRNKVTILQKSLQELVKTRLRDICTYYNVVFNKNYDYRDIKIIFTMNLPQDDVSMAQIITQLNGKLSAETGLNQLSFVQDAKSEYRKALEEQQQAMDINNVDLDNLEGVDNEVE